MRDKVVLYYQVTLGGAHLARIRALDSLPGISCRGIQLASKEKTRDYQIPAADTRYCETLVEGTYEEICKFRVLRAAARHLRVSRPDAIIVDSPADPVQLAIGRLAQRRGILTCTRWAATWWDHPRKPWKEWLKGFVYRGWDVYLATGERGVAYLKTFGVPDTRVFVCGNPVDAAPIERARLASPGRTRSCSFLFVGRFLRLKNLERFAEAYLEYRREGGTWELHLVGFGESETAVRSLLGNDPSVHFYGSLQQEELISRYLADGCLVLPSYSENWGLVVNEAMHAGMPILVSTRSGCYPALLEEGGNGFGMDALSVESMRSALHRVEHASSQCRERMSVRSLRIIEGHRPEEWAKRVQRALQASVAAPS